MIQRILADILLGIHASFVAFVVCGLLAVLIGAWFRWQWVRNFWLRAAHLAAITIVVLQAWFGTICPLTTWEMALRESAGVATYQGAFVAHWVHEVLYYQASSWMFAIGYTLFGVVVWGSWILAPPRLHRRIPSPARHDGPSV